MNSLKTWSNLLRIGLSFIAVALLLHSVGVRDVGAVLRAANLRYLGVAWVLFLTGIVIRTFRWRALLCGLGLCPPFWRLLRLYLVGGFFNAFLPSGFGGDVIRVLELTQEDSHEGKIESATVDSSAAVGTVLVDRMTGILSLMALGLLILPFTNDLEPWLIWTLIIVAGGGLLGGFLVLEGRLLRKITAFLPNSLSLAGEGILAKIYAAVTGCGPRAIAEALALSTVFNLLNIVIYWLCGLAVGISVGIKFHFITTTLLSLTLIVPVSVGGLGIRDWVAQPLFASVGIGQDLAAAMTLCIYAVTAAAGLVGGVLYMQQALRGLFGGEK